MRDDDKSPRKTPPNSDVRRHLEARHRKLQANLSRTSDQKRQCADHQRKR